MDEYSSPPPSYPPMYPPQPALYALPKEIIELLLDSSLTIEKIRHNLMGEVLMTKTEVDEQGNQFLKTIWEPIGEKVMCDIGVRAIVNILDTYIGADSATSNLTSEEISRIMTKLDKTLSRVIYERRDEFEIKESMMTLVKDGICDKVFLALKKSENAKFMESLLKSWNVAETRDQSKKAGMMDVILSPLRSKI